MPQYNTNPEMSQLCRWGLLLAVLGIALSLSCAGPVRLLRIKGSFPVRQCTAPVMVLTMPGISPWGKAATQRATAYYNAALGTRVFHYSGDVPIGFTAGDMRGVIVVTGATLGVASMGEWIGYAVHVKGDATGCWAQGILRINTAYPWPEDKLQTVLRHELGHALGLGESTIETRMMYWQVPHKEVGVRVLSDAEIERLKWLYGIEED